MGKLQTLCNSVKDLTLQKLFLPFTALIHFVAVVGLLIIVVYTILRCLVEWTLVSRHFCKPMFRFPL